MKKQVLAMFLALMMVAAVLSACGGSASSASGAAPAASEATAAAASASGSEVVRQYEDRTPVTMWFWGANDTQRAAFQTALVDVYNSSQDEFELVMEQYVNTVDDDIPVALAAGAGPDIIYTSGPSFSGVYTKEGLLVDLTKYSEQYGWKERLLPAYYDACMVDGVLYTLPNSVSVGGVFYNKELWEENGWTVPTTLEEMEAIMADATSKGLYAGSGGNRGWRPSNDNFSSVMINHFVSPTNLYKCLNNEQDFNNPEMVAGVAKMHDWYQMGALAGNDYTSLDSQEAMQLVVSKQAALIMAPTLYIQFAANIDDPQKDNLGFFPMPNGYAPGTDVYDLTMPCSFGINANSKNPDAAAAVLDIMMSAEFSQGMTEKWPGYWGVPLADSSAVDTGNMTGLSALFMEIVQNAAPAINEGHFGFHPSCFFPPVTQDEWRNVEEVWNGTMSAEDFLAAVDKAFDEEFAAGQAIPVPKPSI